MKLTDITPEDTTVYVGLLTEEQKDSLVGVYYAPDSIYNPIQDADDNWVISVEEMQDTTNEETLWVKDLPLIEYVPKPTPPMPQ
jgi:hypothetical protein